MNELTFARPWIDKMACAASTWKQNAGRSSLTLPPVALCASRLVAWLSFGASVHSRSIQWRSLRRRAQTSPPAVDLLLETVLHHPSSSPSRSDQLPTIREQLATSRYRRMRVDNCHRIE